MKTRTTLKRLTSTRSTPKTQVKRISILSSMKELVIRNPSKSSSAYDNFELILIKYDQYKQILIITDDLSFWNIL